MKPGAVHSGALTYAEPGSTDLVEETMSPAINASVNGPYQLRGRIAVTSSRGHAYEVRNRQTLCRCGGSSNKPFCDGTHWKGFKDPVDVT